MIDKLALRYTAVDDLGRATSGKGRVTLEQLGRIDEILAGAPAPAEDGGDLVYSFGAQHPDALAAVRKAMHDQVDAWATEMHRWRIEIADRDGEIAELKRLLADRAPAPGAMPVDAFMDLVYSYSETRDEQLYEQEFEAERFASIRAAYLVALGTPT